MRRAARRRPGRRGRAGRGDDRGHRGPLGLPGGGAARSARRRPGDRSSRPLSLLTGGRSRRRPGRRPLRAPRPAPRSSRRRCVVRDPLGLADVRRAPARSSRQELLVLPAHRARSAGSRGSAGGGIGGRRLAVAADEPLAGGRGRRPAPLPRRHAGLADPLAGAGPRRRADRAAAAADGDARPLVVLDAARAAARPRTARRRRARRRVAGARARARAAAAGCCCPGERRRSRSSATCRLARSRTRGWRWSRAAPAVGAAARHRARRGPLFYVAAAAARAAAARRWHATASRGSCWCSRGEHAGASGAGGFEVPAAAATWSGRASATRPREGGRHEHRPQVAVLEPRGARGATRAGGCGGAPARPG